MFGKKSSNSKGSADQVYLQNAFKTLVANIRFASVDNPIHVIGVTSSIPNEGKSTTSYALAQALANGGQTVLLIDCDLRRRSLANMIGVHAQAGIYAVLSGQVPVEQAAVRTKTPGLYLLDCEPHIPNPVDILSSKRFKNFVAQMREKYTYVLIDTPPLSAFIDGAVISQNVDGMLLVVRQGLTKRDEILSSFEQLKKADANIIGTVLTFCESDKSEYYYSYYNKDGKRVRRRSGESDAPKLPDAPLSQQAARPVQAQPAAAAPRGAGAGVGVPAGAAQPGAGVAAAAGSNLKPISAKGAAASTSAKSGNTMSFLAQAGYRPKTK